VPEEKYSAFVTFSPRVIVSCKSPSSGDSNSVSHPLVYETWVEDYLFCHHKKLRAEWLIIQFFSCHCSSVCSFQCVVYNLHHSVRPIYNWSSKLQQFLPSKRSGSPFVCSQLLSSPALWSKFYDILRYPIIWTIPIVLSEWCRIGSAQYCNLETVARKPRLFYLELPKLEGWTHLISSWQSSFSPCV
jgi:hypothetical protein